MTLRVVFGHPLRQTEGFLDSLLSLMSCDLKAPDHTTLSRRNQMVVVPPLTRAHDGPSDLIVDSTGLKILGRGPFSKRWPGWVALGVTFGVLQTLLSMSASVDNVSGSTMVGTHAAITLPTAAAFFYGSRMGGIYEVPPQHRTQTQGDKQFGSQDKLPESRKGPRRD